MMDLSENTQEFAIIEKMPLNYFQFNLGMSQTRIEEPGWQLSFPCASVKAIAKFVEILL